jgi:polyribonucleotide nucleotidyltransferase
VEIADIDQRGKISLVPVKEDAEKAADAPADAPVETPKTDAPAEA